MKLLHLLATLTFVVFTSFSAVQADVCPKDHISDDDVWTFLAAGVDPFVPNYYNTQNSGSNAVVASSFTGNGDIVTRAAILVACDQNGTPCTGNWWSSFTTSAIFYPDAQAFQNDPFGTVANSGVQRVNAGSPVNLDLGLEEASTLRNGQIYNVYRFEFDVSAFNFQTTQGNTHYIALLPESSDPAVSGRTFTLVSNGNGNSVGFDADWFMDETQATGPTILPRSPHTQVATRVILQDTTKPLVVIDQTNAATIARFQNNPLLGPAGIDVFGIQWIALGIEFWQGLLGLFVAGDPLVTANWSNIDEFEFVVLGNFTAITHDVTACRAADPNNCSTAHEGVDNADPAVIRDSIGNSSATTDGNGFYGLISTNSLYTSTASELTGQTGQSLQEIELVVVNTAPPGTSIDWNQLDYRIQVWEDLNTAFANPTAGTIGTYVIGDLIEPAQAWGTTSVVFGPRTTYRIRLDLSGLGVQFPASGTLAIGLATINTGSTGTLAVVESQEAGPNTDWQYLSGNWSSTTNMASTQHDGRYGIKVIAQ